MTMKFHSAARASLRCCWRRRRHGPGADPVGHLADYTGATSDVGVPYGQGMADAIA